LDTLVLFTVVPSQVYATCPAFLPMPEAELGPTFLESQVGLSTTVSEFQGLPGNDALIPAISFLETRRNHKGPNQVSDVGN
jgi:hypothetical protein